MDRLFIASGHANPQAIGLGNSVLGVDITALRGHQNGLRKFRHKYQSPSQTAQELLLFVGGFALDSSRIRSLLDLFQLAINPQSGKAAFSRFRLAAVAALRKTAVCG